MTRNDPPVVIVGASVAGLALARMLQSADVPYLVLERRPAGAETGLAFNLPGNAIQALTQLGLREEVEASGRILHRREYRTVRDRILFDVDEDAFWGEDRRPRSIRREDLIAMLAKGLDPGSVRYGVEVASIAPYGLPPQVTLADGRLISARVIVGADGVHSIVRSQLFGGGADAGAAKIADASWRFMAPNHGIDCWTVWAGRDGMLLLMPVGGDQVYGWAAITRKKRLIEPIEALLNLAFQFPRRVHDAVRFATLMPGGLYHSPLEEVRLERWSSGGATLIGDAAHATAPVWAEGVALALEDALVLGQELSKGAKLPAALGDYEARRRPRVEHVQRMTDAMSKAAKLPPLVRDALLPIVGPKRYRQTYAPLKEPPA
jgi:2-polyprenyl-6-methoxyphenol hydroxylase-like FAD-dependent oxidoreductase